MALPHLIKFVYNNGTDEVIRRGKKIHAISYVELIEHDDLLGSVTFRVKDDSYATYYKVYVQKYKDPKGLSVRCTCPYNLGDICRHETAALLQLQDLLDKNVLGEKEVLYHQRHTVIKMKDIELKTIRLLSSPDSYAEAENIWHTQKANIISAANERVEASLVCNGDTFPLVIQKNDERNFDTSCKCEEQEYPLCVHKVALFLQLLNAYGPYYFDTIRNWDKQKNKLLEIYGYSLDDDLTGKFEFTYKDGKPFLRVLDPSIKRANPVAGSMPASRPVIAEKEAVIAEEEALPADNNTNRIGIVFNGTQGAYPHFGIDAVSGELNETGGAFTGKVEKLDLSKFIPTENYSNEDKQLLQQIRKLTEAEVNKYVSRNSPFSGIWENIIHHEDDDLPEETRSLIGEYWYPKLLKLFNEQKDNPLVYFLPHGKNFITSNLLPVQLADETAVPVIHVNPVKNRIGIACYVQVNGVEVPLRENEWKSHMLFKYADTFYNWSRQEDILEIERFANKENLLISKEDWPDHLKKNIIPLTKTYKVRFSETLVQEVKDGNPEVRVLLQEKGDYLLFVPVFSYKGFETRFNAKDIITLPVNDKVLEIHRNRQAELQFIKKLESLHSNFIHPEGAATLALKGA
ncbi:MAG TPA: SWIM zinc finger family protein, partial [Agriterribacter sp.]|nr:SWIM zinc finger family protein [Agriterribacter sp.]